MKLANILLSCMICTFCLTFLPVEIPNVYAFSMEEEKALGQESVRQISRRVEIIEDASANQFINDLGQYLIEPLETRYFPFDFYIIKDDNPNAFATAGGHIFISSGLIQVMDSIDELAAVMVGMIAGVMINGPTGAALVIGSMAMMTQYQLYNSRDNEHQADMLGFKYTRSAGFDPSGMITLLNKIENTISTGKSLDYLRTHPAGSERIAEIDTLLSVYGPADQKAKAERFRYLFPFFRAIVIAECVDYHEAKQLLLDEAQSQPDDALFHFSSGIIYKENSMYESAIYHLQKSLEDTPNSTLILRNLSKAYQMDGQNIKALSVLKKSLEIDIDDELSLFLLGVSYENLGQYERAAHTYEKLVAFGSATSRVYYHLGVVYGKLGKLSIAHHCLGTYFKQKGQMKKAAFHLSRSK